MQRLRWIFLAMALWLVAWGAYHIFLRMNSPAPSDAKLNAWSYSWPEKLEFTAPLDLPHINNYPVFARAGAQGELSFKNDQITITLAKISHAAQRNVWFDCARLDALRMGLTHQAPYTAVSEKEKIERWSDWQSIQILRAGAAEFEQRGAWQFLIPAQNFPELGAARIALQVRCTTARKGESFTLQTLSRAAWLSKAAHAKALAADPCDQNLSLRQAIGMQCEAALKKRLASKAGQDEVRRLPYEIKSIEESATWLDLAIAEKMPQALAHLVKAGVAVNSTSGQDKESALIFAAGNGDSMSVRELLRLGANKNYKDAKGFTAYNAAAYSGYGDLAMELAEQGVERDANSGPAYTALALAAYQQDALAVRRLLESGSDPDGQIGGWRNALHHAAASGNVELARTLLAGGANTEIQVTARRGETALMIASEMGHVPMLDLLLRYGAKLDTRDKMGKNATDYAEFFRKKAASDFLCSKGLEPTGLDTSTKNGETAKRENCQSGKKSQSVGR